MWKKWSHSPDDIFNYSRFLHVGQLLVEDLKGEDQLLVVHSEEVQHGVMQIPQVDEILDHVVAEVIGLAIVHAALVRSLLSLLQLKHQRVR